MDNRAIFESSFASFEAALRERLLQKVEEQSARIGSYETMARLSQIYTAQNCALAPLAEQPSNTIGLGSNRVHQNYYLDSSDLFGEIARLLVPRKYRLSFLRTK